MRGWFVAMGLSVMAFGQQSILLDSNQKEEPQVQSSSSQKSNSAASTSVPAQVRSIKTSDGQQLQIATSQYPTTPNIHSLQSPNRLIVDLANTRLSSGVQRTLSFEGSVIRVGTYKGNARIVMDFGAAAIPAYQVSIDPQGITLTFDTQNPKAAEPSSKTATATPSSVLTQEPPSDWKPICKQTITNYQEPGRRVRLDLKDAEIRNVLRLISNASGMNIVCSDNVKGRVTMNLRDVPWREALIAVLQVKNLTYTENRNVIRVMTLDEQKQERNAQELNGAYPNDNGPIVTRLIPVNYADATQLKSQVQPLLSPQGSVSVDQRTNVLVINDIESAIKKADRLVQTLDTQTPQILVEVRMVEASTVFSRSLGIQWGGQYVAGNNATLSGGSSQNYLVNLPATSPTSAFGINLGIGNFAIINAKISAAETKGMAKTISMPKILALDNKPARIRQGYQIPYSVMTQQTVQTQFFSAALQLDVTPRVASDGSIAIALNIANNEPDFEHKDNLGVPAVKVKEASTDLLLQDGQTAVIGGIYTHSLKDNVGKVPVLGDIPILGLIFKNSNKLDSQSEMMVFLTPHILNRRESTVDPSRMEDSMRVNPKIDMEKP